MANASGTCETIGDALKTIASRQQCCHCNPWLPVSFKRGCREFRFGVSKGVEVVGMEILEMRRRPRYPNRSPDWPRWARGRSCTVTVLFLGPEARNPKIEDSKQSKLQTSFNSRNPRSLNPGLNQLSASQKSCACSQKLVLHDSTMPRPFELQSR